ncbi:acyl-CoA N-acyltransferase [Microdochium bolleyi]|uniref:Acyl-CoA N-acyltransferase n=1 Tax=Microdochium bolleyi TaxID=196109 RepID=A0A136INI8_9PEZI|nr:acyl-CoA N-acyltransferase [Microdochium bolleyi]
MAQPDLTFRHAAEADIPALLALIQSAYRGEESCKGWTTEADLVEGDRIDEPGLRAKIAEPDGAVLVATVPGPSGTDEIIACCEVLHRSAGPVEGDKTTTTTTTTTNGASADTAAAAPQVGYFGLFAVSPTLQGGGIGRRVLEHAEGYARQRWPGVAAMEMTVIAARADIIAWYGRRGYVPSATEPTRPFPHEHVAAMKGGRVLRDDLYFVVLEKVFG